MAVYEEMIIDEKEPEDYMFISLYKAR